MQRMIAKRKITYAGKQIPAGGEFEVLSRGDAAVLFTLHYAVPVQEQESKVLTPGGDLPKGDPDETEVERKAKPKRRYRRRDMQAE